MAAAKRGTALITGASGGIGAELAKIFAREGFDVVLVARRKEELEKLAGELAKSHGVTATAIAADLTKPGAADELFAETKKRKLDVDALVNNAGFGTYGHFLELDLARELQEIQLNVVALTHLTKLFGGPMAERKRGWILNVASTAGFQPGPLMAVYYATKAYVLSLSEALTTELKPLGIHVTALCPGPTESGFQSAAKMQESMLFKRLAVADAASVAEQGFRGVMRGRAVVVTGMLNKMMVQSVRVTPRAVVRGLVLRMQGRRHGGT